MSDLPIYQSLSEKRQFFSNGQRTSFVIKTTSELDDWFQVVEVEEKQATNIDSTALIYRGLSEAKHKLLTSAQRLWISNEMEQWARKPYLDFINDLVKHSKQSKLIKKVFDLYNYNSTDREFPILSLLQHYGAPTPLMDWTYNSNVAFFFATDTIRRKEEPKNDIDDYFAIYRINKRKYKNELLNIIDIYENGRYPELLAFKNVGEVDRSKRSNSIYYLSDFERKGESTGSKKPYGKLLIRTTKPLTSMYNQNIIPQEGLFIFNPFADKTLEQIFNTDLNKDGWNLALTPFDCFNIHKDLADYLKRKIEVSCQINKSFIYPNLNDEAKRIKEAAVNGLI